MATKHQELGTPALPAGEKIKFSFEYYDTSDQPYCISEWQQKEQIKEALKRLKEINNKSFDELRRDRRVYHFEQVNWDKTTKKSGFPDSRANTLSAFHFSLLGVNGQKTRVFGAYYRDTFYIVWFDLNHEIWPSFLKNT